MARKNPEEKRSPAKKGKTTNKPELRLTELERVELSLTERDVDLQKANIDLARARIDNLTMGYHRKIEQLKQVLRDAQIKHEHLAQIRNRKLSEIESRLKKVEPDFDFRDYLEQDDGLLVPAEDLVPSEDSESVLE